jgi:hypothetical protein
MGSVNALANEEAKQAQHNGHSFFANMHKFEIKEQTAKDRGANIS